MGSTNDPGDYERRYKRQKQRISDLRDYGRENDATTIRKWANSLTQAYSTRANHVKNVVKFAERAALTNRPPITEMSEGEFWELHDALEAGDSEIADADPYFPNDGLGYGSLRNVRQSMKHFLSDELGREWADDIQIGKPKQTHVTEDDVFNREETQAIIDACNDTQEQALVALLLGTGQRISAVHSLKLGDVEFRPVGETTLGFITIRPEVIGTKGMAGERPLTWATPYVKNWVGAHPRKGEKDAPLFCAKQGGENRHGEFSRGDPIQQRTFYRWLGSIGERAGVDKPMNPHTFRHTAITRMYYDDVPEKRIKWMVGWDKDSTQFERYVHLQDQEMMEGFLSDYGYEEAVPDVGPAHDECPNCHAPLHDWANPQACPGCGLPLGVTAAEASATAKRVQSDATEAAIEAGKEGVDSDVIEAFNVIREEADAEAIKALAAELRDGN